MQESGYYIVKLNTDEIVQGPFPTEESSKRILAEIEQRAAEDKQEKPQLEIKHLPPLTNAQEQREDDRAEEHQIEK